ncbi:MAG: hypothetical protein KIH67_003775 [Candidatus Moranbacteria bacterium]|nr:hypothetical protein [Candidatus Moranbacteria bacterium]
MKIAIYYSILFLVLLLLQFSFLNILFSFITIPLIVLIAGAIWTLRLGFHQALWLLIPLLILHDLLGSGKLEIFSVFVIFFAYTVSFLSRRVLLESVLISTIVYSLFIYLGMVFYALGLGWYREDIWIYLAPIFRQGGGILLVILGSFWVTRSIILRFQRKIDQLRSDSALMIR